MRLKALLMAVAMLCVTQSYAAVIYVDNKAGGANNGTSWVNAYTQIQSAVTASTAGDEIWVGSGTYNETRPGGAGEGSLELKANVALYGGFQGNVALTGFETARSQRNPLANVAIIDGVNGRGIGVAAYHVVAGAAGAVLDGFTVQGGNANGAAAGQKRGGGINILNVTMTVSQCIIRNNRADDAAGGLKLVSNASTIERCAFINNDCNSVTSGVGGGAICIENGPGNAVIQNCTFFNNRSQGSQFGIGGGAITISGAGVSTSIKNCSFYGNTSVSASVAPSPGTGTAGGGGAIYVVKGATPTILNSIFWGDVPANNEIANHTLNGAEAVNNAALPTLTNCIVQGTYAGPGAGNTAADPLYVSPGLGNLLLQSGSPARDTGNNTGAPSNDYLGTARPLTALGAAGGTVDKGAYEYDATPPTAVCLNQLLILNAAGSATLNINDIDNGSSDAGGVKTRTLSKSSVNCSDIPTTSVTLTVTDYAGNSATCNATITVQDNTNPNIISCAANQVLTANGSCQAVVPDLASATSANDACGIASITQTPLAGATISATTNVLITVTDVNGRTSTCTAQLTIADNTNPVISVCAANQSIVANASCQATLPDLTGQVTATDNCGTPTVTQSPVAGTVISAATLVTFTATDGAGRTATCQATISLQDNTNPTITTCPPAQNLVLNGSCQVAVPNLTALAAATDNCTVSPTITQSPVAGTIISAAGVSNVTITATDLAGNTATCPVQLNVADATNPVITVCASNTTVNLGPACNAALPNLTGGVTATDNCGAPTITQAPVAGTIITANTLVTLTATDPNGNTATCQATVNVQDVTNPVITVCASPRTISRSGTCDTLVPNLVGEVTATDNCTATPTITQSPLAGSVITANTSVTLTATDASGNTATCQALMTLVDDQDPVITQCALDTTVQLNASCQATIPNLTGTVASTDNCAVLSTTQSPVAGTVITADTVVTFTVTDTSSNTAQCTANVTIDDSIPPVITVCPTDQTLSLSAQCDAVVPDFTALTTATDNCTVASITQLPTAGTIILANTSVTITATDGFGNTDTCTVNANVVDSTPPVITRNGGGAVALLTGQIYTELGATASDNCDTNVPVTIGGDVVDTNTVGVYIVTYDAVDDDGNNAIQVTRQVTVTLNTPPVITITGANPVQVECQAVYTDDGATAFDADQGDITGDMTTVGNVNTAVPGDYQVTYEVTDNAFTTVQEIRTVQVRDTTPPVITITGQNPLRHECSTPYIDPGATATDICDGSLTSSIVVSNPVNPSSDPGDYNVTYTVTDAGGNTTIETRVVEVRDATIPVLTLNGGATVQHECGAVYSDLGAFANDTCDGDISVLVVANNPVDANSDVGDYTVTYNVLDSSNNAAVQISRTVQVRDTVRPVITLNGANVVAINITQPYVEQGATAFDLCDGDLTSLIITTGSVNVNVPGTYSFQYNVVDSHGNNAVQVIRQVLVQGSSDPPVVIDPPNDVTVNFGVTAQFEIVAASPVPITYRWRRNGVDINDSAKFTGTGTATLTILNSANPDEANYSCRVTNTFGNNTSTSGALTVLDPAIIQQPQSRSVIAGATSVFTVVAIGSGTLQYQWYKDGNPLGDGGKFTGTATASLSVTDTQNPEEGDYWVTVTGADGTLTSTTANLEVGNPAIVDNPVDLTIDPGQSASFTVVVQGTPPILYRWRKNGVNMVNGGRISGANTSTLTITDGRESDEGSYDCVIVGQEIVICNPATLKVNDPPVLGPIVGIPTSFVFSPGANGTLSATILTGTPPFTFQWRKNGSDILTKSVVNGTSQVLNVTNAAEADEGSYTCVVTNSAGQATAVPVTVKVGLTLFSDLRDATVEEGTNFNWSVGVGGGIGNIIFEWFKEDTNSALVTVVDNDDLTGTGTGTLHFAPIAFVDDGFYQVTATDNSGSVTSRLAKLTVVSQLPIAGGLGLAALAGAAALLGAVATRRKK